MDVHCWRCNSSLEVQEVSTSFREITVHVLPCKACCEEEGHIGYDMGVKDGRARSMEIVIEHHRLSTKSLEQRLERQKQEFNERMESMKPRVSDAKRRLIP